MSHSAKPTCTLFILTLSLLGLYTTLLHHPRPPPTTVTNDRNTLFYRSTFLSTASNYTVASYLRHLTLRPHVAGTPLSLSTALYVQSHFETLGLVTHMTNFSALLSYPTRSYLSAHFSNGTVLPVPLSEPNIAESDVVVPYHAYSPSGSAYGEAVFLNYGREEDYRSLVAQGVEVKGCVGLVRRGSGMSRYEVVAHAAAHGLSAVLMYTEGECKEGVERGTVMNGLGDPLTPGWAGVEGGEKLDVDDPRVTGKFPGVPSLPVSESSAEIIIGSLEGAGVPYEWRESFARRIERVGPGPTMLNFTYEGEKRTATIHNVFATIRGSEEPDRLVLLGNHRDAWTYGAVDPNSGTSVLLDIARRLALLMRLGWNPRRTIVLCSWDAEEFGMIGSTEWVEQNLVNLGSKAVAYLNVDCAVQGPGLFVSATPQLDDLLVEVAKQVKDPDSENVYVHERWIAANKGVDRVPSVDLYFGSVAGIWGLVAFRLADDPILPFNFLSYATELQKYNNVLNTLLEETISLHPITVAIQEFTVAANETEEQVKKLRMDENVDESTVLRRRMLNDRLMLTERGFLDPEGLEGRQWFKHLIYGPRGDPESKIDFFPGIADALSKQRNDEKREAVVKHEVQRVARAIERAASALRGEFT
ncbi:hypothetical protein OROGR_018602 [Orobanche gracilis]